MLYSFKPEDAEGVEGAVPEISLGESEIGTREYYGNDAGGIIILYPWDYGSVDIYLGNLPSGADKGLETVGRSGWAVGSGNGGGTWRIPGGDGRRSCKDAERDGNRCLSDGTGQDFS